MAFGIQYWFSHTRFQGARSGLREVVAFQCVKPIDANVFQREKCTRKEYKGKTMYVSSPNGFVSLQYDDRTVVTAGSEQMMGVYLAGDLGLLPKWLPAKAWESFRGDHFVMAADTAMMRREMKPMLEYSQPIGRAALLSVSSLWEDATGLAAGARWNDKLAVHAWAMAKDADSAARVQRTAEALKTLAGGLVTNFRRQARLAESRIAACCRHCSMRPTVCCVT